MNRKLEALHDELRAMRAAFGFGKAVAAESALHLAAEVLTEQAEQVADLRAELAALTHHQGEKIEGAADAES